jgi:hypothetical protein
MINRIWLIIVIFMCSGCAVYVPASRYSYAPPVIGVTLSSKPVRVYDYARESRNYQHYNHRERRY